MNTIYARRLLRLTALVAVLSMLLVHPALPAAAQSTTATHLLTSGPVGQKYTIAVIGDGFAANDQAAFDAWVNREVIDGVFARGPFWEDMNAFNIIRINAVSTDSGVTLVDAQGRVTNSRNTALDFRFSGNWSRCWNEPGPQTQARLGALLKNYAPSASFVIIVLNGVGGGCNRGSQVALGSRVDWHVLQHEMGHMAGLGCDEYVGGTPKAYTNGEPGCPNLTINTNRQTLKWGAFVDPATPLPTTFSASTMNVTETAGAFEGGSIGDQAYSSGIWRPTSDGAMRSNLEAFGPVDYDVIKQKFDQKHAYTFLDALAGDFDGNGLSDVVIHNENSLAFYPSNGSHVLPLWIETGDLPGWDLLKPNDNFIVGDFDGDHKDDLFVYNFADWAVPYLGLLRSTGHGFEVVARYDNELPGWDAMRRSDQFFVGDFDADGKDDLYVFNGRDWSVGYLGMLRSTGGSLEMAMRYDRDLPGWDAMRSGDEFYVADVNGDGADDLAVFNGRDWAMGYLELLASAGNSLVDIARYDDELPAWDKMRPNDQFYPADFDGDGMDDLFVFNGRDWQMGYLELLHSTGDGVEPRVRYDDIVPGWDKLRANDRFFVADVDGDKFSDLYAYNAVDWDSEYLGILLSSGETLDGYWQKDWVDGWNLGADDQFLVGNYSGGSGWDDLIVRNADWLGLLRSQANSVAADSLYYKWIHDFEYHKTGLW